MDIKELLRLTKERNASDLILTAGSSPVLRIDKRLVFTKLPMCSPKQIDDLVIPLLDKEKAEGFKKNSEVSFIYSMSGWGRFRITVFKQRGATAAAIRRFPYQLPTLEELHLPEAPLVYFSGLKDGLVLVTGPTGGGKSTTLASVIQMINKRDSFHIITLEEPIEYLFKHSKSVIEQRAIPYDSPSFASALRDVMRQTPDVLMIGEIRDPETLRHTLRAAEAGILVLATFHTSSTTDTLNRLISFFPREEEQARLQLSMILRGVFSQQLIPIHQKQGLMPAWEVLIVNERVIPLIREGSIQQIDNVIETSAKFGMQSMDQTLVSLYDRKLISKEELLLRLRHRGLETLTEKEGLVSKEDEKQEPPADAETYHPNF